MNLSFAKTYTWTPAGGGAPVRGLTLEQAQEMEAEEQKRLAKQSETDAADAKTAEIAKVMGGVRSSVQSIADKATAPTVPVKDEFGIEQTPKRPDYKSQFRNEIASVFAKYPTNKDVMSAAEGLQKQYEPSIDAADAAARNELIRKGAGQFIAKWTKKPKAAGADVGFDVPASDGAIEDNPDLIAEMGEGSVGGASSGGADEMAGDLANLIANTGASKDDPVIKQLQEMVAARAKGGGGEPGYEDIPEWQKKYVEEMVRGNEPLEVMFGNLGFSGRNVNRMGLRAYAVEYAKNNNIPWTPTGASAKRRYALTRASQFAQTDPDIFSRKISKQIRGLSGSRLAMQAQAAERAIATLKESRDPETGTYKDISNPIYTDLMADFAKILMPSSSIGIEMIKEVKQGSLRGDLVGAWNFLAGKTETTAPQEVLDMLLDRFEMLNGVLNKQLQDQIIGGGPTGIPSPDKPKTTPEESTGPASSYLDEVRARRKAKGGM